MVSLGLVAIRNGTELCPPEGLVAQKSQAYSYESDDSNYDDMAAYTDVKVSHILICNPSLIERKGLPLVPLCTFITRRSKASILAGKGVINFTRYENDTQAGATIYRRSKEPAWDGIFFTSHIRHVKPREDY